MTYFVNSSISTTMLRDTTCMTANAEYSGSAMCRTLRISASRDCIFLAKAKGSGSSRCGGSGAALRMLLERTERMVVMRWVEASTLVMTLPVACGVVSLLSRQKGKGSEDGKEGSR